MEGKRIIKGSKEIVEHVSNTRVSPFKVINYPIYIISIK